MAFSFFLVFESDAEHDDAARLAKRWHKVVCVAAKSLGWSLENLGDLARVLRLPGTLNHFNGTAEEVRVLESDFDRRYNPDDFEQYLAAGTGFRRNEIRSMTRESFDLDANPPTITVEAAYSKHRRRDVQPIRRDLADLLRPWLAWKKPGRPVIETSIWNWDDSSRMIQADLKVAEVPFKDDRNRFADFHSLRHTYITNIGRLPVSLKTHQELARHSQPGLTMRYTHTQLEDKVRALEALPAVNTMVGASERGVA